MEVTLAVSDVFNEIPQEAQTLVKLKGEEAMQQELMRQQLIAGNQSRPDQENPWIEFLDNIDRCAVDTGRTDGSINHDHYLHGAAKRG